MIKESGREAVFQHISPEVDVRVTRGKRMSEFSELKRNEFQGRIHGYLRLFQKYQATSRIIPASRTRSKRWNQARTSAQFSPSKKPQ